jgi:hypothetical protein
MTQKGNPEEAVSLEELTLSNSMQVDTLACLLIEKGIITKQKFFTKLKHVQSEYQARNGKS